MALGLSFATAVPATEPGAPANADAPKVRWADRADELRDIVRANFYDAPTATRWAEKHARYAQAIDDEAQFVARTRAILGELRVSHTGYFPIDDPKHHGLKAIFARPLNVGDVEWESAGADFSNDGHVRVVFAGGAAAESGLRRGDKILSADGQPFGPVASFRGRAGQPVKLAVQRQSDQPPLPISLTPRRVNPKAEWLDAQKKGAQIVERGGQRIAYVPMFACAGEEYETALKELLQGPLRDAAALVLDFRDGYGGCNPSFINLFSRVPARLTFVDRSGQEQAFDSQWRKPVVLLINGGTSSGKEVVAHSLQKHKLATLVGQRTAGAVLAGRCFLLRDGSLLYLATADVRVDGHRLEGVGVRPDIEVPEALPWANGADPIRERALTVAEEKAREQAAAGAQP